MSLMLAGAAAWRRVGSGGGGGDPYWAYVVSLLHFNGADGSPALVDQTGKVWTPTGSALLTTSQYRFGGASLDLPSSPPSRIDCTHPDFNFGTNDFTVEAWLQPNATSNRAVFSFGVPLVYAASGSWAYFNGGNVIIGGRVVSGAWTHVALTRSGGIIRLFANGVQVGNGYSSPGAIDPGSMRLGWYNSGNPSGRFYDEFRVTRGVARYVANFTPPTQPFPDSA